MQEITLEVKHNRRLADRTYEMVLHHAQHFPETIKPGQFINLKLDGYYLRRPISICDWTEDTVTIIYKTVGRGTEAMSRYETGRRISTLMPLGNGFVTEKSGDRPLLVGGGAGAAPLYGLCKKLLAEGRKPVVVLGFNNASEIFYIDAFHALGVRPILATVDGSRGVKGFVTDAIPESPCARSMTCGSLCAGDEARGGEEAAPYTYFYACGPAVMLKALEAAIDPETDGQMSFEQRMGCGFGACMGCTCQTKYGTKRICKEGPVLERSEILW